MWLVDEFTLKEFLFVIFLEEGIWIVMVIIVSNRRKWSRISFNNFSAVIVSGSVLNGPSVISSIAVGPAAQMICCRKYRSLVFQAVCVGAVPSLRIGLYRCRGLIGYSVEVFRSIRLGYRVSFRLCRFS